MSLLIKKTGLHLLSSASKGYDVAESIKKNLINFQIGKQKIIGDEKEKIELNHKVLTYLDFVIITKF